MDWPWLLRQIGDQWSVVKSAPLIVVPFLVVVATFIYLVLQWLHKEKMATLEQRLSLLKEVQISNIGGGSNPSQHVHTQPETWNDDAHFTLAFDKALTHVDVVHQENVRYYYWYPVYRFEWQLAPPPETFTAIPDGVIVFLSLKEPTHTMYHRVYVLGGGIQCRVLGHNAAGATVQSRRSPWAHSRYPL